jgi:hypothetical protein
MVISHDLIMGPWALNHGKIGNYRLVI